MSAAKIIQRFGDDGACIWQAGKNFACGWVYQSPMYLKWFDSPQAARMAWEIDTPVSFDQVMSQAISKSMRTTIEESAARVFAMGFK